MGMVRNNLRRVAALSTRFIARRWGESFPFYYIIEYPKSGGTWLSNMVADYLQLPRPRHYLAPLAFSCVVQWHCRYSPHYRRVWFMYRDGRDVAVSHYFHRMREMVHNPHSADGVYARRVYPQLFGAGFNHEDIRVNLPRFIEHEARNPRSAPLNWSAFMEEWHGRASNVVPVSYEELLADTAGTLARIIPQHTGQPVDMQRLETTVRRFSFESQTGRKPGQEDQKSFLRKGIAGDWKNHFTRESAEVFDRFHGPTLVKLGYEPDNSWVSRQVPLRQIAEANRQP